MLDADAQSSGWTWRGGGETVAQSARGSYGTQGTAATTNDPGGRTGAISWTDQQGNFWLFGGIGNDSTGNNGYLNDLWKFNTSSVEWAWIAGSNTVPEFLGVTGNYGTPSIFAANNHPGGRANAASWVDVRGNLWLFGGSGYDSTGTEGFLNDLWEFDTSKQQWAWMGGSDTVTSASHGNGQPGIYGTLGTPSATSIPGGRSGAASWVDASGNFWLFGGQGYDSNDEQDLLNDLWEYDPTSNEWVWMAGGSSVSGTCGCLPATYGSVGLAAAQNTPGGRISPSAWTDQSGSLWLFGGFGIDAANNQGGLNDLWMFTPSSGEWAWMGGASTLPAPGKGGVLGVFGTEGVPSISNMPGSRDQAVTWVGADGHLWLFGGGLYGNFGALGRGSDLWEFDSNSAEWTWWGGDGTVGDASGVYGTLGTLAAGDLPGGRVGANSWADKIGNLWLFGGTAIDSAGNAGELNDIWSYQPKTVTEPAASPVFAPPAGTYTTVQSVTLSDATAGATIYYTTDGSIPTTSSAQYTAAITVSTSETIQAIAVASGDSPSAVATANYTIILSSTATPAFSVSAGTYTTVQSVTLSDATAGATIYYTTDGTTPKTSSTQYSAPISVSTSETIQAIAVAPGYAPSALASATYTINLPPPTFGLGASPGSLSMSYGSSGKVTLTVTPQNGFNSAVTFACSGLPAGATCTFSPTTVTPAGSASTTTLTVTAPAQSAAARPLGRSLLPASSLALVVGIFGWKRRRYSFTWLLALAACAGLGMMTACGGGGSSGGGGGSKTITATVTVTATSGSLQQTASFNLTVN